MYEELYTLIFCLIASGVNLVGYKLEMGVVQVVACVFIIFYAITTVNTTPEGLLPVVILMVVANVVFFVISMAKK